MISTTFFYVWVNIRMMDEAKFLQVRKSESFREDVKVLRTKNVRKACCWQQKAK